MSDELHLSALPAEQQQIWDALSEADLSGFMLYGGTALALRYGHRLSVDFDFFGSQPVTPEKMAQRIPWLADHTDMVLQDEQDTYTVQVTCPGITSDNSVKLSFFGNVGFPTLDPPHQASNNIEIAAVRDILATKLKAVHGRTEPKDYIDIAEILRRSNSPVSQLQEGLADYAVLFPSANQSIALKALCWFAHEDLEVVNPSTRKLLTDTVLAVRSIPEPKAVFRPRIGQRRTHEPNGDINL